MTEYFLVAGLGNPSANYGKTRHNAGFWFAEKIAADHGINFVPESRFSGLTAKIEYAGRVVLLLKPQTYMNLSGRSVGAVSRYYKLAPEKILVAHDELDFPAGITRLKMDGGHGGHNGLKDIIANIGSNNFLRLRIGIGHPGERSQVLDYVLGKPAGTERQAIDDAITRSAELLPKILCGAIAEAMNSLHAA
ncbi:MAG: aminoacyl-tRNA hydrolase [Methylococcales bacterium]